MKSKHTSDTLARIIESSWESQSEFANACGVSRQAAHRDLSGTRKITDERFQAYLRASSTTDQIRLLQARVRDLVPSELHKDLIPEPDSDSPRIQEVPEGYDPYPNLSADCRVKLAQLQREMNLHSDIQDWFVTSVDMIINRPGK